MALMNNIGANTRAKMCVRSRYFGRYNSFSDIIGFSSGEEKEKSDAPYLDFLMEDLEKLKKEISELLLYEDESGDFVPRPYLVRSPRDGLFVVIVPNFDELDKKLTPIVSEDPPGISSLLGTSLENEVIEFGNSTASEPYFAGNANMFVTAREEYKYLLNGYVFSGGEQKSKDRSIIPIYHDTISMCYNPNLPKFNRFIFKFSTFSVDDTITPAVKDLQPTAADFNGFGGLTPVIYTNAGITTVYGIVKNDLSSPKIVENTNYADVLNIEKKYPTPNLGFHLFAYQNNNDINNILKDSICIICHQDGKKIGSKIDPFRDRLYELGYQNVVGMDGSGSAFLYDYCKIKYIVNYTPWYRDRYMYSAYAISK